MPDIIENLILRINKEFNKKYNYCLVNRYKNGKDSIGFHKDSEKELNIDDGVAAISLGQTRDLILKEDYNSKEYDYKFTIVNGSLYFITKEINEKYYHGIVKEFDKEGIRISLTFRNISE